AHRRSGDTGIDGRHTTDDGKGEIYVGKIVMNDQSERCAGKKQRNDESTAPTRGDRNSNGNYFENEQQDKHGQRGIATEQVVDFVMSEVSGQREEIRNGTQQYSTDQSFHINGQWFFLEKNFEEFRAINKSPGDNCGGDGYYDGKSEIKNSRIFVLR